MSRKIKGDRNSSRSNQARTPKSEGKTRVLGLLKATLNHRLRHFYAKAPPRAEPKGRLTQIEMRMLSLFVDNKIITHESGLEMVELLDKYREKWADELSQRSICSAVLRQLVANFFVNNSRGLSILFDKHTESYRRKKQSRFWLGELALLGLIRHDENGWVIWLGNYLTPEVVRAKVLAREQWLGGRKPS